MERILKASWHFILMLKHMRHESWKGLRSLKSNKNIGLDMSRSKTLVDIWSSIFPLILESNSVQMHFVQLDATKIQKYHLSYNSMHSTTVHCFAIAAISHSGLQSPVGYLEYYLQCLGGGRHSTEIATSQY